ncbi:MAG: hypothetical protein A3D65_01745 [Candidatus Lloydbacteria bacterium RIFCSPHIGHO2_02_FULL_50_13]|uniref:Uncharacterized protein n=1 Tax=Candidatus Lloydbacteria bacterium RIFCSPHIGHO2_02_FULL_50_13 TaxID=1798661 RepID=A0A1G2DBA4_9BACT|nr:MAG: hypothetical protein A3D65_01745 [Candidatus Lloydbacteria bacterium RIFCSPHIGHO2_02_FULL_50_13]
MSIHLEIFYARKREKTRFCFKRFLCYYPKAPSINQLVRPSNPEGSPTGYLAGGTTGKFFGGGAGRRPPQRILRPFILAAEPQG